MKKVYIAALLCVASSAGYSQTVDLGSTLYISLPSYTCRTMAMNHNSQYSQDNNTNLSAPWGSDGVWRIENSRKDYNQDYTGVDCIYNMFPMQELTISYMQFIDKKFCATYPAIEYAYTKDSGGFDNFTQIQTPNAECNFTGKGEQECFFDSYQSVTLKKQQDSDTFPVRIRTYCADDFNVSRNYFDFYYTNH